ncbi:UNVERIFIED_CONTAM: hypothetical protein RMT77_009854 [Armadillidium vulgare]
MPSYTKESSDKSATRRGITSRRSQSAKISKCDKGKVSPTLSLSLRRTTSTVSLADSQILSKFLSGMSSSLMVSERDKRILELLALKHEKRFQEELTAFQTHQKWKEEREREIKSSSVRWQEWQKQVNDKRRRENEENERRWKALEEEFTQSQENLSISLREKDKRSQDLLRSQDELRLRQLEEKKLRESAKRAMVLALLQQKEEKLEKQRERLVELWDKQQKRIERARQERREMQNWKLAEVSSAERKRHEMRQQQVEAEGEALLEAMRNYMENRMKKSEHNLMLLQQTKEKSLRKAK